MRRHERSLALQAVRHRALSLPTWNKAKGSVSKVEMAIFTLPVQRHSD